MPEYLHPGVYIEETSFRTKPIEGVSTSTVGLVGRTLKGPEGKPTLVTSFAQFVREFGNPVPNPSEPGDYLGHAVRAFFDNGGKRAYIVRALAKNATRASVELQAGTVLRLPPHRTVRGPTKTLPLTSLRNIEKDKLLHIYRSSSSGTPFLVRKVDRYDARHGTVTLDAEIPPGETLDPSTTYVWVVGEPPESTFVTGPSFEARHRGLAGENIAVEIRPRDGTPVRLTTRSYLRAHPQIASQGPEAGTTMSLTTDEVKRLRVGDTVEFGDTGETATIASINPATVTIDPGTASGTHSSGFVRLLERDGKVAPGGGIVLSAITATPIDFSGSGLVAVSLPHDAAAWLRPGDTLRVGPDGSAEDVTVDSVTLDGNVALSVAVGDHSSDSVRLVKTSETSDLARLAVGDVSGLTMPFRGGSFEPIAVFAGTKAEMSEVFLVDTETNTLLVKKSSTPAAGQFPTEVTLENWQRFESLQLVADGGRTLPVATTAGFYTGAIVELDDGENKDYYVIESIDPGARTVTLDAPVTLAIDAELLPEEREVFLRTLEMDVLVYEEEILKETFSGLTWNDNPATQSFSRYYVERINDAEHGSKLIHVTTATSGTAPEDQPTTTSGFAMNLQGGSDGTDFSTLDLIGSDNGPGNRRGIEALKERDDISLVAVPGVTDEAVQQALITHCELLKYRFAVLDGRPGEADISAIESHRNNYDSKYAAYYAPWVETIELSTGGRRTIPPSGAVLGLYARTDNQRGVHKAPANDVIRNVLDIELPFTNGEQDVLNPVGVNLIREFVGRGIRVWGARTLSSDPEWKYINVRRLFIFLEHSIDRGTQWVVFEPNNEALWTRVRETIESFLFGVWKTGALMGTTPEQAYFVRCDRTTMTQDDIDNGRLVVLIGVAPTKPAEFVVFRIGQLTASSRQS